jgi:hypothetical protein
MSPGFFYNDYDFDEDTNYLIYFRGNFGPPTKGHFSLVEKFIDLPNVKILISQIGSQRHGVPYWLNRKIWKIYIQELLPREKIYLKELNSSLDVLKYIQDVDKVIFLKGKESDDIQEKEIFLKDRYADLFHKLRKRKIKLDYLIIDRPLLNTLSTSKFIEAILKNKSYDELKFFVPEELSFSALKYIIKKLRKENLK